MQGQILTNFLITIGNLGKILEKKGQDMQNKWNNVYKMIFDYIIQYDN